MPRSVSIEVEGKAIDPHLPCDYEIRFFDFDDGQTATITFSIHPPSGRPTVLLSENRVIGDDSAGGGQDEDVVLTYSGLDSSVSGTSTPTRTRATT